MNKVIHFLILVFAAVSMLTAASPKDRIQEDVYRPAYFENKGQLYDQNKKPRPDILYFYGNKGLKIHLKQNSFSYELYREKKIPGVDIDKISPEIDTRDFPADTFFTRFD
ncbi:MAG: hypothetical protein ACOCZW_04325 [Bacteroidota bacterium]